MKEKKVKNFADQMLIELNNNQHKGSILDWNNFDNMITELEYHKAKMLLAIRTKNKPAIKEYIADCGNILLAIGNIFGLYDQDSVQTSKAFELNKDNVFTLVDLDNQQVNQTIL